MLMSRISPPSSDRRPANSSHQETVFTGCEANGIVFDDRRKTWIRCSRFQRRIASSASRFRAVTSRIRAGVAFASRIVRLAEGSSVWTQA